MQILKNAKSAVIAISIIVFTSVSLFSKIDRDYQSWEIMRRKGDTVYIRFQINIPFTMEYLLNRKSELEEILATLEDDEKRQVYAQALRITEYNISRMQSGKTVKNVWIIGSFNDWKVTNSRFPNELEPVKENPSTYYTKTLIPFVIGESEYKFVINYGILTNQRGEVINDYVIVDDPTVARDAGK
jgi:hypothetical protein